MFGILSKKSGFHQQWLCHNDKKGEGAWPEWKDTSKRSCHTCAPLCLTLTDQNGKECTEYPCSNERCWYFVFSWNGRKYFLVEDEDDIKLTTHFCVEALHIEVPKGEQVFTNDWNLGRYLPRWLLECPANKGNKYSFVPFNSCSLERKNHASSSAGYKRFRKDGKRIPTVGSCSSSSYDSRDIVYTSISGHDSDSSLSVDHFGKSLNTAIKIPLVGQKNRDPIYICPDGYREVNGRCIKNQPHKPCKRDKEKEKCPTKNDDGISWIWLLLIFFLLIMLMVGLFYWWYRRNKKTQVVEVAQEQVCYPTGTGYTYVRPVSN